MNDLAKAVAVTAELTGTDLSDAAAEAMVEELSRYPRSWVIGALHKCRRELKGRLTIAAVLERLEDGRPGPEEAWSMMPRSEAQSIVWTGEMAESFGVAARLLEAGDKIGARMAFKEAYQARVNAARERAEAPRWTASLGHDPHGREDALRAAVAAGRLGIDEALGIHAPNAAYIAPKIAAEMPDFLRLPEGQQ